MVQYAIKINIDCFQKSRLIWINVLFYRFYLTFFRHSGFTGFCAGVYIFFFIYTCSLVTRATATLYYKLYSSVSHSERRFWYIGSNRRTVKRKVYSLVFVISFTSLQLRREKLGKSHQRSSSLNYARKMVRFDINRLFMTSQALLSSIWGLKGDVSTGLRDFEIDSATVCKNKFWQNTQHFLLFTFWFYDCVYRSRLFNFYKFLLYNMCSFC